MNIKIVAFWGCRKQWIYKRNRDFAKKGVPPRSIRLSLSLLFFSKGSCGSLKITERSCAFRFYKRETYRKHFGLPENLYSFISSAVETRLRDGQRPRLKGDRAEITRRTKSRKRAAVHPHSVRSSIARKASLAVRPLR